MSHNRFLRWLTILILLVGGVYYYRHAPPTVSPTVAKQSAKGGKKSQGPAAVTTTRIETGALAHTIESVGTLEAEASVTLKARVDGQVEQVLFQEGQEVDQGDILFTLDSRGFASQLRQARANLERDQALLARARQDLQRSQTLARKEFASQEKLDAMRAEVASLTATESADRAQVEHAELQLGYATITAPIAGVVGVALARTGHTVRQNDTPLVVIHQIQPLQVRFAVPDRWLPRLQEGMRQGQLPVVVRWQGESTVTDTGQVVFIDNAVDASSGTITLKAAMPNPDKQLLPGQFVRVLLTIGRHEGLMVPSQVVQFGQKGAYLYRLDKEGLPQRVSVTVVSEHQGQTILAGEVAEGEEVVLDGHLRVNVGEKVHVTNRK